MENTNSFSSVRQTRKYADPYADAEECSKEYTTSTVYATGVSSAAISRI